jgi:hypothetical protein
MDSTVNESGSSYKDDQTDEQFGGPRQSSPGTGAGAESSRNACGTGHEQASAKRAQLGHAG